MNIDTILCIYKLVRSINTKMKRLDTIKGNGIHFLDSPRALWKLTWSNITSVVLYNTLDNK